MKQNIIMLVILLILFLFGLLIYDFSDAIDKNISDYKWYRISYNKLTAISFKDQNFSYYYVETKKPVSLFESCNTYRYNRSINVIKLNCHIKENKLFLSNVNEKELTININGEENHFYINETEAIKADFMKQNNLNEEQYNNLMDTSLTKFNIITFDDVIKMFKSKKNQLIAFVNDEVTIQNALNLKALHNFINNTNNNIYVVDLNNLEASEIEKFNNINIKIKEISAKNKQAISIYSIGNKEIQLITGIEVKAFSELDNYNINNNQIN